MTLQDIRALLASRDCKPTGDHQISARCPVPAHDDRKASLSVSNGDKGILIHCHAGCTIEAICASLGITQADLFNGKSGNGSRTIVAEYDYVDADGKPLFQVVRFTPKDFRQRHKVNGEWVWKMDGVKRVLFRLPLVLDAIKKTRPIFVCEGEKDCLAVERAGFAATCNPGGAGKWQASYSESLRGAEVVIIADKDLAGRKHAADVAAKLDGIAASVKVIEVPDVYGKPCKDAADFFAAGGQAADLDELAQKPSCQVDGLPPIIDAHRLIIEPHPLPPEIVEGILHKGHKLMFGGGSKTFKTWVLADLAISVAHGEPWLSFKVRQGRVLYVNLEIQPEFFASRLEAITKEKHIEPQPGRLDVWNLRGFAADYMDLLPKITAGARQAGYVLIILDPIYKLYATDTDENSAKDVAALLRAVERLTVDTGAAVAFGAHFSKGNQAGKEAIDRVSGSGVFARDPDSLLTFTAHETEGAFTVEATLRNLKPVKPFCVRWLWPLMRRANELDPAKLKQAGAKRKYTPKMLLDALSKKAIKTETWQKKVSAITGMSRRTFFDLLEQVQKMPEVKKTRSGQWVSACPPNGNEPVQ